MRRKTYSITYKSELVQRMLSPGGPTVSALSAETGIPTSTLAQWWENAHKLVLMMPGDKKRKIVPLFWVGMIAACVFGCAGAVLLFVVSEVLISQIFSVAAFFAGILAGLFSLCRLRKRFPRQRWFIPSLVVPVLIGISICISISPSGRSSPDGSLHSVYLSGNRPSHLSPVWLVSEGDQVRLGGRLLPLVDTYLSNERAAEYRGVFSQVYSELESSREFTAVGTVVGEAYVDMFVRSSPLEHLYLYLPRNAKGTKVPPIGLPDRAKSRRCEQRKARFVSCSRRRAARRRPRPRTGAA